MLMRARTERGRKATSTCARARRRTVFTLAASTEQHKQQHDDRPSKNMLGFPELHSTRTCTLAYLNYAARTRKIRISTERFVDDERSRSRRVVILVITRNNKSGSSPAALLGSTRLAHLHPQHASSRFNSALFFIENSLRYVGAYRETAACVICGRFRKKSAVF